MSIIVLAFGILVVAGSAVLLVAPNVIRRIITAFLERNWIRFGGIFRIVIGVLFLLAAGDTRFPAYIRVVGALTILAGLALLFLDAARVRAFLRWWMDRPLGVWRTVAPVGIVFGGSLIWAAI